MIGRPRRSTLFPYTTLSRSAKIHLRTNGVFIFDCWYGPGVLTDPPAVRTKTLCTGPNRLTRLAEPVMRVNENAVEVNLRFELDRKSTRLNSSHSQISYAVFC